MNEYLKVIMVVIEFYCFYQLFTEIKKICKTRNVFHDSRETVYNQ